MPDRDTEMNSFLATNGLQDAQCEKLAGDASNRRYFRLRSDGTTYVFMDAPPDRGEDVAPFVRIASFLAGIDLSAPQVLAKNEAHGFLLLEDLGDDLFARLLEKTPDFENRLYDAATDALVHLHSVAPLVGLPSYDANTAAELSALVVDWYVTGITGSAPPNLRQEFVNEVTQLIEIHAPQTDVLVQRDYHSENLLWLPDRADHARVGLLDFQDAMKGHRAYDLVSLLQDARRDVPPEIEEEMIARYIHATNQPLEQFRTAYAVWGAQRNLRILGVFARLCLRDGKPGYLKLMPRVWGLLKRDLAHDTLHKLSVLISETIPEPSLDALKRLEAKCAQNPTR